MKSITVPAASSIQPLYYASHLVFIALGHLLPLHANLQYQNQINVLTVLELKHTIYFLLC